MSDGTCIQQSSSNQTCSAELALVCSPKAFRCPTKSACSDQICSPEAALASSPKAFRCPTNSASSDQTCSPEAALASSPRSLEQLLELCDRITPMHLAHAHAILFSLGRVQWQARAPWVTSYILVQLSQHLMCNPWRHMHPAVAFKAQRWQWAQPPLT